MRRVSHHMAIAMTWVSRGRKLNGMFRTELWKRRAIDFGRAASMLCRMS